MALVMRYPVDMDASATAPVSSKDAPCVGLAAFRAVRRVAAMGGALWEWCHVLSADRSMVFVDTGRLDRMANR